jgi:hypothetical protein
VAEYGIRFRGGVFCDARGWGVIVVIDALGKRQEYRGDERYSEQAAEAEYRKVREAVLPILQECGPLEGFDPFDKRHVQSLAKAHDYGGQMTNEERKDVVEKMKYTKKPITVEAIQWTGRNFSGLWNWAYVYGERHVLQAGTGWNKARPIPPDERLVTVLTLNGPVEASVGEWIIKGVEGEFYPCAPDIFEATYSPYDPALIPEADAETARLKAQVERLREAMGRIETLTDDAITGMTLAFPLQNGSYVDSRLQKIRAQIGVARAALSEEQNG